MSSISKSRRIKFLPSGEQITFIFIFQIDKMNNKISMTDEEIKEHLKDPNYSSRSLEPWTLNPAMRRKTHEFMQEVIKKMMVNILSGYIHAYLAPIQTTV